MNAIRDYRRSQWQKKVADAMEQFEVAGISQTHDEMVRKIEETTAVNEARMEMALGNVDQQKFKIEEEAEKLRASELVKQFKVEMGLISPEASAPAPRENHRRSREAREDSRNPRRRAMAVRIEKGGWTFIFLIGLGAGGLQPGQVRRRQPVWHGSARTRTVRRRAVDTSKPLARRRRARKPTRCACASTSGSAAWAAWWPTAGSTPRRAPSTTRRA